MDTRQEVLAERRSGCLAAVVVSWCSFWLVATFLAPAAYGSCFERVMRDSFAQRTRLCSHTTLSWSLLAAQFLLIAGFVVADAKPRERRREWIVGLLGALAATGAVALFFLAGMEVRLTEPRPWAERASPTSAIVTTTTTTRLDLAGQDLTGLDLAGVEFTGARLEGVVLNGADLAGRVFVRAVLDDAELRGADLSGASFRFASLRRADLSGADARSAVFVDAGLQDASLVDTDLTDANLRRADLRGTDLRRARLSGADLGNADLTDADLAGATHDQGTTWPAGFRPP